MIKLVLLLLICQRIASEVDYCFVEGCACDSTSISCVNFMETRKGHFGVKDEAKVDFINFWNSIVYYLDFLGDFTNLEKFTVINSELNCSVLMEWSGKLAHTTFDVRGTCKGNLHTVLTERYLTQNKYFYPSVLTHSNKALRL